MMKEALHSSIISFTKDLEKYSEKAGVKFDADIIHELRTTFKKFRALLRWQKIDKEVYAAFKKIYDTAGRLRNIQVAKEMLKKEKNIPYAFKAWLTITLLQLKEEWDEVYDKKIPMQLREDVSNLQITPTKHKKFFSKKIQTILNILSITPVSDDSIHDIRKMVKDMQYVLEWWKDKKGGSKTLLRNISIKQLKTIGTLIGEYNDKRTLLNLLISYSQQEKDPALINEISPVIYKWQHYKVLQKEKLLIKLKIFAARLNSMSREIT